LRAATASIMVLVLIIMSLYPVAFSSQTKGFAEDKISCTVRIAAVSSEGEGVLGNLTVTVEWPGQGKVFISTSPAAEVDTQGSAVIASLAASILAGVDPMSYNFYYEIEAPSIIIGGPSAGAAMALATYQLLTGGECDSSIVATGMIQPDTSIGPVGGLKEKLEAVAGGGGKVFIVPAGQSVYTYTVKRIRRWGPFVSIIREPVTVNLTEYGSELGVSVVEAASLLGAVNLMRGAIEGFGNQRAPVVPGWLHSMLGDLVRGINTTVHENLANVSAPGRMVSVITGDAADEMSKALEALDEGHVYAAAVYAIEAGVLSEIAAALSYVFDNGNDVTDYVVAANQSIERAWSALENASRVTYSRGLDMLLKAYGKLGIALYYYEEGLNDLVLDDGRYRLPASIFGGYTITGLMEVVRAKWLAEWASFWINASRHFTTGATVDAERLGRVAKLMVAVARTSAAYLDVIMRESGSAAYESKLPAYLVEQAITSRDPVAQLGFSLQAIADTTSIIHETFTLKPNETADDLRLIASWLYGKSLSPTSALILDSLEAINDSRLRLEMLSLSVLQSWVVYEATQNTTSQGVGATAAETSTRTEHATNTTTTQGSAVTTTAVNLRKVVEAAIIIAVIASVIAILIHESRRRAVAKM